MTDVDVVVAGAGPAGALAARELARTGHRVLMADPLTRGTKIGEALPGAAGRLLRAVGLGAVLSAPHVPIGGNLSSWGDDDLTATDAFAGPDGPGWRLDRAAFENSLRAGAVGAGAVFAPIALEAAVREGAAWRVGLADGTTVTARWLVDATGRRSTLARRLGARRLRDAPLVALYALGEAQVDSPPDRTLVEATPDGWWYAGWLPSGKPIAGFHTIPAVAARLTAAPRLWQDALVATRHAGAFLAGARLGPLLPPLDASGGRLAPAAGEGWIACGDAVQAFDPLSSLGILSALASGLEAARTVSASLAGDAEALPAYRARLDSVRSHYRARLAEAYRSERQWPEAPYWAAMSAAGAATGTDAA